MWPLIVAWCRQWRRRDVLLTVVASVLVTGGLAVLLDHGVWVLAPLLLGCALLWRTPLTRYPFDVDSGRAKPFVQPWQRDARRAERRRRKAT